MEAELLTSNKIRLFFRIDPCQVTLGGPTTKENRVPALKRDRNRFSSSLKLGWLDHIWAAKLMRTAVLTGVTAMFWCYLCEKCIKYIHCMNAN